MEFYSSDFLSNEYVCLNPANNLKKGFLFRLIERTRTRSHEWVFHNDANPVLLNEIETYS